jgi:hypothetical protein
VVSREAIKYQFYGVLFDPTGARDISTVAGVSVDIYGVSVDVVGLTVEVVVVVVSTYTINQNNT